jgi:undecaprenyl-diphosphatase
MTTAGLIGKLRRIRLDRWMEGRLLLIFFIVAVFGFFFLEIAEDVAEGDTRALDRQLLLFLRSPADSAVPAGPPWLQTAMLDITALGGISVLTLLTFVIAGYLLVARKAATAVFLLGATASGALVGALLKAIFVRPRPDLVTHLIQVETTSFPSGHAMNSAVVFLTLGALLTRTQEGLAVRIYVMAVAIVMTLAVGFSRVYLGVHWPSDVLAGWCVGAAWAALCSVVARLLQLRHTLEQPSPAPQADSNEG